MPINTVVQVVNTEDIPHTAADNPPLTGSPAATVQEMYLQNRFTRFEMLVFAITQGYAAAGTTFETDQVFAKRACDLGRAIAFQMEKYESSS